MFGKMLGGFFDKEAIVRETIQGTLVNVSEELGCDQNELFIMIKPFNEDFDFKCYIYKVAKGSNPALVREISLKEILGDEEDKNTNDG